MDIRLRSSRVRDSKGLNRVFQDLRNRALTCPFVYEMNPLPLSPPCCQCAVLLGELSGILNRSEGEGEAFEILSSRVWCKSWSLVSFFCSPRCYHWHCHRTSKHEKGSSLKRHATRLWFDGRPRVKFKNEYGTMNRGVGGDVEKRIRFLTSTTPLSAAWIRPGTPFVVSVRHS